MAQPFELIRQHTKKKVFEMESQILNNPSLRQTYMTLLNDLCFLALQADEFNAEKSRNEKPDLITSNCVDPSTSATTTASPPKTPKLPQEEPKKKLLKRTKRSEGSFMTAGKPPNILVYCESAATRDNTLIALKKVLKNDT